jgi:hypothetical protein
MPAKKKHLIHSFSVDDAQKYGVNKAILLHNLRFWLEKSKANADHIYEDHYWIYNTSKAFGELFPYFAESSISRWLRELEKDSVIMSTDKLNKLGFDHTKWYTIKDEYRILEIEQSNPQDEQTIPDSNPDSNPDKKKDKKVIHQEVVSGIEFPELWSHGTREMFLDFCNMRLENKKYLTERALSGLLAKCDGFTDDEIRTAINEARISSYQSLFPKAANTFGKKKQTFIPPERNIAYSSDDWIDDGSGNLVLKPELERQRQEQQELF